MKSAILGLDAKVWIELYDKILETQDLPEPIREMLEHHKRQIQSIYKWIEGEWWKKGWRRIYFLENRFGKMVYEINQEQKVFPIILHDLEIVRQEIEKGKKEE